jgi:ornithine carbamoyltransferase
MSTSEAANHSANQAPRPGLATVQPEESLVGALEPRVLSLGGVASEKLPAFTISTRLQARSILLDTDLTPDEIAEVLETSARLKALRRAGKPHGYLNGKTLGMLFQHPSTRTRVSFEAGMAQLGGRAIFLGTNDLQIKRGETIADTAQVLSRYVDALVARVALHTDLEELAGASSIPVINGLTDRAHPMQALADLLTMQEQFGDLRGLKLAYLGDGNNVARSLMLAGAAMGVSVAVGTPAHLAPPEDVLTQAQWLAAASGAGNTITLTTDPLEAAKDADAVYTDVHVSMGQLDGPARAVALAPYKVTREVMAAGKPGAVFMHCLPMHRDEEVEAEVADGPQSVIFDQAENRLHVHKAVLLHALCSTPQGF